MAEGGKTVFALRDYMFDRLNKATTDFWEKPTEKSEKKNENTTTTLSPAPKEEDLPSSEEGD